MVTERTTEPGPPGTARSRLLRWAGWFALANFCFLLVISWRYLRLVEWSGDAAAQVFLVLALVGDFATMGLGLWLVLGILAAAWPNRWVVSAAGVGLGTLLVLGILIDSIVFTLFRFHLNGMVWSLLRHGGITESFRLSFHTWATALVLAALVLGAEVGAAFWAARRSSPRRRWRWRFCLGAGLVIGAGHLVYVWADAVQYTPIVKVARFLPAYRPLTVRRTLTKLGWKIGGEAAVKFKAPGTALKYPLQPLVCQPPPRSLNVLFIVVDGWRRDLLDERVTPGFHRFAQRSLRFERHSAVANATYSGIFALFYGLYGSYWPAMLAERKGPLLIHQFKQAGYEFAIFMSARLTGMEFERTVFREIRDQIPLVTPGNSRPERDREITRRMLAFLDERPRERPFCGFLFYDSTHGYDYPAEAPAPFQPACAAVDHLKLDAHSDPVPIRNRYLNAAHFVDSLAAPVLARLERDSLLDRTVVIITGDHGEEFNETGGGYWGHSSNFSRYQTQVPLVVWWPGKGPASLGHLTSHLDIAPTLLAQLFHCSTPMEQFSNGRSLFDPSSRLPLLAATWNRFAILSPGRIDVIFGSGHSEHYDEDYRPIATPLSPALLSTVLEGMSRFYAR